MDVVGLLKSLTPKRIGLILGPMLFLLLLCLEPFALGRDANWVLAVAFWMVTWWVTEAVPLPVTALLPMLVFPLLGVRSLEAAAKPYGSPIVFLFFGGFMLALGLEEHLLHKRMALNIIRFSGFSPRRLVLGFMVSTAALSMWISNTATALMMLPMAISVLNMLRAQQPSQQVDRNFATAIVLSIAYGANIGGMGTLIGSPPNMAMAGILSNELKIEVTFVNWLVVALPISVLLLIVAYGLLVLVLFPCQHVASEQAAQIIADERQKLGAMTGPQWRMAGVFLWVATLWVVQDAVKWIWPWLLLNDTSIALFGVVLLFVIPADIKAYRPLLDWSATTRLPWGILLLFGGGLSLADALRETQVINAVGDAVAQLSPSQLWITVFLLTGVALYLTELMSNVALVNVFVPVLCGIALSLKVDPLALALPATLASSCAFMLPISTPPNAIVFSSGQVTIGQMVRAGFWLNLVCWVLIVVCCQIWFWTT
ncbi:MAG TPA: DASS family sodium-coupled anion symporter [Pirellulaceae bacterium]|nr:DASS family sodium-coupled anion symporter [Pirellulaceae bacterium]